MILEQLARENGVFFSDRTKPCVEASTSARFRLRDEDVEERTDQCMVTLLGKTMSTSSFAMYTFSTAVLVQALTLVCFSSFADHGKFLVLAVSMGYCNRSRRSVFFLETCAN